jgi:hypothetical protein
VAEGARLESVFTSDRNAGSNPAFSAISPQNVARGRRLCDILRDKTPVPTRYFQKNSLIKFNN